MHDHDRSSRVGFHIGGVVLILEEIELGKDNEYLYEPGNPCRRRDRKQTVEEGLSARPSRDD